MSSSDARKRPLLLRKSACARKRHLKDGCLWRVRARKRMSWQAIIRLPRGPYPISNLKCVYTNSAEALAHAQAQRFIQPIYSNLKYEYNNSAKKIFIQTLYSKL
jgi:hypothetical protein